MTIDVNLLNRRKFKTSRGFRSPRIAEESIVASELLGPPDSLRFLRPLVASLQAEEQTLGTFVDQDNIMHRVM